MSRINPGINTAPKSVLVRISSDISSIEVINYCILLIFIEFYSEKLQLITKKHSWFYPYFET